MQPLRILSAASQVAAHLRSAIEAGRWAETIPGIEFLAAELDVNRKTVDAALKQLERDGVIVGQGPGRARRIVRSNGHSTRPIRIAMLPYEHEDLFLSYIVDLQHSLVEAGHTVITAKKSLVDLEMDPKRIQRLVEQTPADAWIVMAGSSEVLEWFAGQPIPAFALFGRRVGIPIAGTGPEKGTALAVATRTLVELGHRRIVLLCRSERRKPSPGITESAMLAELAAHGIPTSDYNLPDWEETREGFRELLSSLFRVTPPTALVIGIGTFYTPTLQFLAMRGLQVPEQVSLVCTDPDPSFAWCAPTVAHIRWEAKPIVRRIVQWAKNVSLKRKDVKQTFTAAEFIPGGSIGPAPHG